MVGIQAVSCDSDDFVYERRVTGSGGCEMKKETELYNCREMSDKIKIAVRNLLLLLCAAALAEICVFNFRSVQSLFYKGHSWEEYSVEYSGMKMYDNGIISIQDETAEILIQDMDLDVKNIRIDLEPLDSIDLTYKETGVCRVDFSVSDEGSSQRYRFLNRMILHDNLTSQYLWMQTVGRVQEMQIDISMPTGHLFRIHDITFNDRKPIVFSVVRFCVICAVLFLGYGFRRNSFWWRKDCVRFGICEKIVLFGVFAGFYGISWFLMASNPLVAYDNYTPYQELAWALDAGQASLLEKPSGALMEMEDPYDFMTREVEQIEYKYDYAYYDGNYYVYHGILPCLLFYLPVYHLTGLDMPNSIPVFLCCLFFGLGFCALMRQVILRYFRKTPFAVYVLIALTGLFGCQIPFFITQPSSYILTVICAVALVVWGIYFWISAKNTASGSCSKSRIILGSLCMALVAAVRPPLLLYSVLAFPIFGRAWLTDREGYDKKSRITMIVLFAIPYAVIAIPVMYYNAIRFGSPFEFGMQYNLTTFNMGHVRFSLDRIYFAVGEYFFRIFDFNYFFPFVNAVEGYRNMDAHSVVIFDDGFHAGLISINFFLLAAIVVLEKRLDFQKRGLYSFCLCLPLVGIALMILDVELTSYIAYRYQADFSFAIFITAWTGILWLQENFAGKDTYRIFQKLLLAAVFLSVVLNSAYWFIPSGNFPMELGNTGLYYDIYYGFNFW